MASIYPPASGGGGKRFQTARTAPVAPRIKSFTTHIGKSPSGAAVSIPMPAGIVAGDYIVLNMNTGTMNGTAGLGITPGSGWDTFVNGTTSAVAYSPTFYLFGKIALGSESSTTWTPAAQTYNAFIWAATLAVIEGAGAVGRNTGANYSVQSHATTSALGTASSGNNGSPLTLSATNFGTPELLLHCGNYHTSINAAGAFHTATTAAVRRTSGLDTGVEVGGTSSFATVSEQSPGTPTHSATSFMGAYARDTSKSFSALYDWAYNSTGNLATHHFSAYSLGALRAGNNRLLLPAYGYGKSPWTQLFAATDFATSDLYLEVAPASGSAPVTSGMTVLCDIAIGPAEAETVVASDISLSDVSLATYQSPTAMRATLPLRLPKGVRVSVRAYVETTGSTYPFYNVNATLVG